MHGPARSPEEGERVGEHTTWEETDFSERNIDMHKKNCWEATGCGREPGGARVAALGICPAAEETRLDGINHGVHGGRACWAVPGTDCLRTLGGGDKFTQCLECPFFRRVEEEEGSSFVVMGPILDRLKQRPAG